MALGSHPVFGKAFTVKLGFNAGAGAPYECEVSEARIVATPGKTVTYVPLCPSGTYSQVGATTFVLKLVGVQDWSADGLARLLWENAGENVTFEINAYGVPNAADTPAMTGTCVAVHPDYGGAAEEYAEYDLELPITGIPVIDTTP